MLEKTFSRNKKIFSSLAILLFVSFVFAVTFTGSSIRAIKGAQNVTYPIYLNSSESVAGFQAEINYSTNYLTLVGIESTPRTSNTKIVYNDQSPLVKIAVLAENASDEIPAGDGVVLNLIFNVNPNAATGNYSINLNDLVVANISAISLNTSSVNGTFEISEPYNVTFLPPISNFENFTLQNGATLPFKFNVTNENGFVTDNSVLVRIYNQTLGVDHTFNSSGISINETNGFYHVNIDTGKLGMLEGQYIIDVSFDNHQTEGIGFELIDKSNGIGKGKNK